MKNQFRSHSIKQEDVVLWSMNNKPGIISETNYKQKSGEQSMFKICLLNKKGTLIETNWIPENQLKLI